MNHAVPLLDQVEQRGVGAVFESQHQGIELCHPSLASQGFVDTVAPVGQISRAALGPVAGQFAGGTDRSSDHLGSFTFGVSRLGYRFDPFDQNRFVDVTGMFDGAPV